MGDTFKSRLKNGMFNEHEKKFKKICFIPYIGGKFNMLKYLLPLIPPHEIYVEVFGGAASLLLNKKPSEVEVYNDIDGDLVNLFRVVRDQPQDFIKRFKYLLYSRELYTTFSNQWFNGKIPKDAVERAVRFYYLLRCSFSGAIFRGWSFAHKGAKPSRLFRSLDKIPLISERLRNIYVDHLDFRKCIKNWDSPKTFFFLDPPYYGLQYYRREFSEKDHIDLRKILSKKVKGKWLLTYNDHQKIREWYKEFDMINCKVVLASSKVKRTRRKHFNNLIIANYPLKNFTE